MSDKDNMGSGSGLGSIDAFGLDEFGQSPGKVWVGSLAGAVFQSGSAAAVRQLTSYGKWAEAIGGGVGVLAGTIMYFTGENNRAMGVNCIAVSVANGLIRQMERLFAGTGTTDGVDIESLRGLGEVQIEGLGNASVETPYQLNGGRPELVGPSLGAAADQVQLNGGPSISGLGGHFGATLFGGN